MRYEFHPEALAEYHDAAHYYGDCHPGLEERFMSAIERAISSIRDVPSGGESLKVG